MLFFCLNIAVYGRKLNQNFPLLEFGEINKAKLIFDYKTVELNVTENIDDTFENLMQDLGKFECESDICNAEKRILIDDILRKNATLKNVARLDADEKLTRKKREWAPLGSFLKWSGGVMNDDDRQNLHNYLMKLYENQSKVSDQIANLEKKVDQNAKHKSDADVRSLRNDLKQLKERIFIQSYRDKFERASVLTEAILSSHINGHVHGALIDDQLLNNFENVKALGSKDFQLICGSALDCIRSANIKIKYRDGSYVISMLLPVTLTKTFKLITITSIPAVFSNFVLIFLPKTKYLLLDNEELLVVNENFLNHCIENDSDLMFCQAQDVISNVNNFDCLFKAFYDKSVDFKACGNSMELFELESRGVIKLDKGKYWIYSNSPSIVEIKCIDSKVQSKNVTGTEVILLENGCQAKFMNMTLTSFKNEAASFDNSFQANISLESFKEIIERMDASELSEIVPLDLLTAPLSGLKEQQTYTRENSWQAKNQWQENEIKILHAEHNKAIIIALAITIAALIFVVLRKHKSIFILTSEDKQSEGQSRTPEWNENSKDIECLNDLSLYRDATKK